MRRPPMPLRYTLAAFALTGLALVLFFVCAALMLVALYLLLDTMFLPGLGFFLLAMAAAAACYLANDWATYIEFKGANCRKAWWGQ